ncbi:helix-turn-helix domain-containing protein [Salinactinospora qingdaonensis]|uniref:Helix-turn-helix domain-containing protein n=1 Tax=Salinactinospora qingdaonensis TaxID=702744 RepID=A0ABP7F1F8_9ACTN
MTTPTTTGVGDEGSTSAVTRPHKAPSLWSVKDTAAFLGVPAKTLYQWRYLEVGPPSHRIGRHLRYDPAEVRAWVLRQP